MQGTRHSEDAIRSARSIDREPPISQTQGSLPQTKGNHNPGQAPSAARNSGVPGNTHRPSEVANIVGCCIEGPPSEGSSGLWIGLLRRDSGRTDGPESSSDYYPKGTAHSLLTLYSMPRPKRPCQPPATLSVPTWATPACSGLTSVRRPQSY